MSAELARVRRDVARDFPRGQIADGHAFAFGRLSLGIARGAVGGDDPVTAEALRHVRGVSVGTYALARPADASHLALPHAVERITRRGWTPVIVSRDDSTAAYVFARQPGGTLRDLLVVTFEDQELTLVRIHGRLDAAVEAMLAGSGGSDLFGPLQAALGRSAPDQ